MMTEEYLNDWLARSGASPSPDLATQHSDGAHGCTTRIAHRTGNGA